MTNTHPTDTIPSIRLWADTIIFKPFSTAPATENQRILSSFQQAIETNGSLNQIVMQAILHGNAGFGKTSLIKALLGIKVNEKQASTGVLEEPKRIEISAVLVEASSKWTHVEGLQDEAVLLVREVNSDQVSSLVYPNYDFLDDSTEMLDEEVEEVPIGVQLQQNRLSRKPNRYAVTVYE